VAQTEASVQGQRARRIVGGEDAVPQALVADAATQRDVATGLAIGLQHDVDDGAAVGVIGGRRIGDDLDRGNVRSRHGLQSHGARGARHLGRRVAVDQHGDIAIALDRQGAVIADRDTRRRLQHVLGGAVGGLGIIAGRVDGLVDFFDDVGLRRGDDDGGGGR